MKETYTLQSFGNLVEIKMEMSHTNKNVRERDAALLVRSKSVGLVRHREIISLEIQIN